MKIEKGDILIYTGKNPPSTNITIDHTNNIDFVNPKLYYTKGKQYKVIDCNGIYTIQCDKEKHMVWNYPNIKENFINLKEDRKQKLENLILNKALNS